MQCPNCGFENMPGSASCARCQASFEAVPESFEPPRAGVLKCLRPIGYAANRAIDILHVTAVRRVGRFFEVGNWLPGKCMAAMWFSIVPGVGHLSSQRRRAAAVAAGVWIGLFALTVNFYAGWTAGLLLGLLIAWHAGVVFDAGQVHRHADGVQKRASVMFIVLILSGSFYIGSDRVVHGYVLFVQSPTPLHAIGVEAGDTLLAWRLDEDSEPPAAGEYIVFRGRNETIAVGYERLVALGAGGVMVGRVLAAGGSEIVVSQAGLVVDGRPVHASDLPVGDLLWPTKPLRFTLPDDALLVPVPPVSVLRLPAEEAERVRIRAWQRTFVVRRHAMVGRITRIYLPLARRGAVERVPLRVGDFTAEPVAGRIDGDETAAQPEGGSDQ